MFKCMQKGIVLLISFTIFLHGSPAAVAGLLFAETLYTTNVVFIIRRNLTQGWEHEPQNLLKFSTEQDQNPKQQKRRPSRM